jgi:hypothetical protein
MTFGLALVPTAELLLEVEAPRPLPLVPLPLAMFMYEYEYEYEYEYSLWLPRGWESKLLGGVKTRLVPLRCRGKQEGILGKISQHPSPHP